MYLNLHKNINQDPAIRSYLVFLLIYLYDLV